MAADNAVFQGVSEYSKDQVLADSEYERKKAVDVPHITVGEKDVSEDGFIYPTDEERNTLPREPGALTLNTFTIALIEFSERFGYVGSRIAYRSRKSLKPFAVRMPECIHQLYTYVSAYSSLVHN